MRYEYNMLQIPPSIEVATKDKGTEAATYLQEKVSEMSNLGWEFMRIDSFGVNVLGGCSNGGKDTSHLYYVITFRRAANE
ncbi:hypothetical protein HBN50_00850 [Halobacteriovorax sp. GB3]|uniref:hypothetical protein n=1 Tax=Halobacteriovorax sp. GB3 TaxID=2719615 RepID=UPI002362E0A9|nr:hypothetical protein [Halobacteriovorax sp. GB3]MDD0851614.1 hypothetical protein [Halobacteriovorax sp. GB3]